MTPAWERRFAFGVAAHDLIVSGDRMLGWRPGPDNEVARRAVVDVIDAALASGVAEATIDGALARFRAEADRTQALPMNDGGRPAGWPRITSDSAGRRQEVREA